MFAVNSLKGYIQLQEDYSATIVIISVIIACLSSYTAFEMNKRANNVGFLSKNAWIAFASIAMGFGIWAMHFVGMSALSLPVKMEYDVLLTIVSIFPALVTSFLSLYLINQRTKKKAVYIQSGVMMGIGISTMHYTGMSGMKVEAIIQYNWLLIILSILIAILGSILALFVFSTFQDKLQSWWAKWTTALLLGLTVSIKHYIGMMAVSYFVPKANAMMINHLSEQNIETTIIAVAVAIGMLIILTLLLSSRYLDYLIKNYDLLTRFPNRRKFENALEILESGDTLAIWHFHNLERWNQSYGYAVVDQMLQKLALIFVSNKFPSTELYRIEGNRFAIIFKVHEKEKILSYLNNISKILHLPINEQDQVMTMKSVCAYSVCEKYSDGKVVYRKVLDVLNSPNIAFKHDVIAYNPAIHTQTFESEIINSVSRAIENDEFFLVYQPKVCAKTRKVLGYEVLLRWQHPVHGFLPPNVFIPILEAKDEMFDVTDWIIDRVCKTLKKWKEHDDVIQIALNVPGDYVTSPRLLKVLKQKIQQYNLLPEHIGIEITETSVVKSIEEATVAVKTLREEGFSVALDDFGTGVSSLSYLRSIPIDTVKIDKSFIDHIPSSSSDAAIVEAIIALCRSLKLNIVIEGVETEEQCNFLSTLHETVIIQGFYFSKPMKEEEIMSWYKTFLKI